LKVKKYFWLKTNFKAGRMLSMYA